MKSGGGSCWVWVVLAAGVLSACPAPRPRCETDTHCLATHRCEGGYCAPRKNCAANSECIEEAGGSPAVCRAGACVSLTTEHCPTVLAHPDDIADENTVFMGTMFPVIGADESTGKPQQNSVEMARREIRSNAVGLPPLTAGGLRRPIAFIACNDDVDPIGVARHLAETVGVPAIIGPAFSGVTLSVAAEVTIPNGTLLMSPSATSQYITTLNDDDLVWRTSPSDTLQAVAVGGLVTTLETRVRSTLGLQSTDPITLVIANKGDGYGQGLSDQLLATLRFNGMDASAVPAQYFERTNYGDESDPTNTDPAARYAASVSTILAKTPHIVIIVGTNEAVTQVFQQVEAQWPMGTTHRPLYIFTDGGQIPELLTAVAGSDELRQRVFGTVPGTSVTNLRYRRFTDNYNSLFFDGTSPNVFGTAGAYDAVYLLAYAAAAMGTSPLTGAALSQGLRRLVGPGPSIDVGPMGIGSAFAALTAAADGTIDFNGASGPLDFDVDTGEAPSDVQTWCITNQGGSASFFFTGYFYNAVNEAMEGTLSCP